ncbi:MAG: hypothetical protein WDM78_06435 [Puia sp.]
MKKHEYNKDVDMKFTTGHDWHADIWLPPDAQIAEIHLRVYSFGHPDYIYGLSWGLIKTGGPPPANSNSRLQSRSFQRRRSRSPGY